MNKETVICAAMRAAEKYGYERVTRDIVANYAKCSPALVSHYCGTMQDLRDTIVQHAIESENYPVLCQAIGARHPLMRDLAPRIKKAAIRTMGE